MTVKLLTIKLLITMLINNLTYNKVFSLREIAKISR